MVRTPFGTRTTRAEHDRCVSEPEVFQDSTLFINSEVAIHKCHDVAEYVVLNRKDCFAFQDVDIVVLVEAELSVELCGSEGLSAEGGDGSVVLHVFAASDTCASAIAFCACYCACTIVIPLASCVGECEFDFHSCYLFLS
jgi:hypothetical protein